MKILLSIFILFGFLNTSFADKSPEYAVEKFLKKNWDIGKLRSFAGDSENHNFLRVFPDRRNLEYMEREEASFVLTIKGEVSHPLYKIIPAGFFPDRNNLINISKTGETYYYRTPKLSPEDQNVFTAEAWLVHRDQYEKTVSYLKRLDPKRKKHKHLIEKLTKKLERSHIVLDKMELALNVDYYPVAGDLDDDQDVDDNDYATFLSSLGYSSGATEYLTSADYNSDNTVDETDHGIWLWFEYVWNGYHRGSDLHYKFENDSESTITDSSTNSNDGTMYGATFHDTGKVGLSALNFNGDGDYVDCGSGVFLNTNNQITFEAWLKPAAISNQYVLKKGDVGFTQAISQLKNETGWPAFGAAYKRAQTFTLFSDQRLLKVKVNIKKAASWIGGDILVKIYSDGGTQPGTITGTGTISEALITESFAWHEVIFDLSLSAGTYWLVLESPTTGGGWNYFWSGTGTNYYRDGAAWYLNPPSWTNADSPVDHAFELQTEAVITSKISMPDPGFKFLVYHGLLGAQAAILWEDSGLELVIVSHDNLTEIQNIRDAGVDVYIYYDLGTDYFSAENKDTWQESMKAYIDNHSYVDGFFWNKLEKGYLGAENIEDFNSRFAAINTYVHDKGQKVIVNGARYYANNGGSDYYMWNNCLTRSSYTYLDFFDRTGMGDDPTILINGIKKWEYLNTNDVLNKTLCLSYGNEIDDPKSIYSYIGSRVLDIQGFGYVNANSFATASITLADGMKWNLGDRISRTIDEAGHKLSGRFANGEAESDIATAVASGTPVYTSDLISDVFNSKIVDDFTSASGLTISLNRGQVELLNGILRSSTVLTTSKFHHVVVTFDKTNYQAAVYVDGVLSGERTLPDITFDFSAGNLLMGVDYNGLIDEYKLYNRILTTEEILHHYQQEQ
ncbi:MAG: LamG domain-containing protein [Bacteriovoracaceae bacterium]|nr:LamG domain-containing protein [Bacteriovoracaceae bacterium]